MPLHPTLIAVPALVAFASPSPPSPSTTSVPRAPRSRELADGFAFTEGPTADAAGNVFFTDQPNDRILKWSVDGKLTTFLQPAGRATACTFDRAGQPDRLRGREERALVHRQATARPR